MSVSEAIITAALAADNGHNFLHPTARHGTSVGKHFALVGFAVVVDVPAHGHIRQHSLVTGYGRVAQWANGHLNILLSSGVTLMAVVRHVITTKYAVACIALYG